MMIEVINKLLVINSKHIIEIRKLCVFPNVGLPVVSQSPSRCSKNPAYIHLAPEEEASHPVLTTTGGRVLNLHSVYVYHSNSQ